jgi:hypothetical protein
MVVPPAPLRRRIMLARRLVQLCCLPLVPRILAPVRLLRAFLRPLAQTLLLLVAGLLEIYRQKAFFLHVCIITRE